MIDLILVTGKQGVGKSRFCNALFVKSSLYIVFSRSGDAATLKVPFGMKPLLVLDGLDVDAVIYEINKVKSIKNHTGLTVLVTLTKAKELKQRLDYSYIRSLQHIRIKSRVSYAPIAQ